MVVMVERVLYEKEYIGIAKTLQTAKLRQNCEVKIKFENNEAIYFNCQRNVSQAYQHITGKSVGNL